MCGVCLRARVDCIVHVRVCQCRIHMGVWIVQDTCMYGIQLYCISCLFISLIYIIYLILLLFLLIKSNTYRVLYKTYHLPCIFFVYIVHIVIFPVGGSFKDMVHSRTRPSYSIIFLNDRVSLFPKRTS